MLTLNLLAIDGTMCIAGEKTRIAELLSSG